MPDITMCPGDGCPLKEECYRYYVEPDRYQGYFTKTPYSNNECEYLLKIKK